MATVFANGRSIVHKGDGQTNVGAIPDVCKTPSPGGPVPIPYVNTAMNSNLATLVNTDVGRRADGDMVRLNTAIRQCFLECHAHRGTTTPDSNNHGGLESALQDLDPEFNRVLEQVLCGKYGLVHYYSLVREHWRYNTKLRF